MIEYKLWEGKWPHVILLSPELAVKILYYETGFEQPHPLPEIHNWMIQQGFKYQEDWRMVRVDENPTNRSDWAICFNNKNILQLFVLKWL